MDCPKCGYENSQHRRDCIRCGVIFAKIRVQKRPPLKQHDQKAFGDTFVEVLSLRHLLLQCPDETNIFLFSGRAMVLLGMLVWGIKLIFVSIESNASGESFLHLVNLPFHEAGHVIFRPLGRFIASLGGTLGQLLVPLACMATLLLKTRDPFGGAVCLWWFGENFLDIAPYINDARSGQLPLLGGNFGHSSPYGFHDWEYLLTETGLLNYDHSLARLFHGLGSFIIAAAIAWALWLLFQRFPHRQKVSNG